MGFTDNTPDSVRKAFQESAVPAKWDTMTRKQLMATATEYGSERDAAKQDTLRAFDERNVLLDQLKTATNDGLELAAKVCEVRADFDREHASALEYAALLIRSLKT